MSVGSDGRALEGAGIGGGARAEARGDDEEERGDDDPERELLKRAGREEGGEAGDGELAEALDDIEVEDARLVLLDLIRDPLLVLQRRLGRRGALLTLRPQQVLLRLLRLAIELLRIARRELGRGRPQEWSQWARGRGGERWRGGDFHI